MGVGLRLGRGPWGHLELGSRWARPAGAGEWAVWPAGWRGQASKGGGLWMLGLWAGGGWGWGWGVWIGAVVVSTTNRARLPSAILIEPPARQPSPRRRASRRPLGNRPRGVALLAAMAKRLLVVAPLAAKHAASDISKFEVPILTPQNENREFA